MVELKEGVRPEAVVEVLPPSPGGQSSQQPSHGPDAGYVCVFGDRWIRMGQSERERERECVCVCLCVVREKREREGMYMCVLEVKLPTHPPSSSFSGGQVGQQVSQGHIVHD